MSQFAVTLQSKASPRLGLFKAREAGFGGREEQPKGKTLN